MSTQRRFRRFAVLGLFDNVAPASAHAESISADPVDGSVIPVPT